MKAQIILLLFSILLLIPSCKKKKEEFPVVVKEGTLRGIAESKGIFRIGSLYEYNHTLGADGEKYTEVLASEFNYIQDGWAMNMESIWIGPHEYNFTYADHAAEFAVENNMKLRGTHLIWHGSLPTWPEFFLMPADEFEEHIKEYIDTVMTHFKIKYPGLITEWNVVNEILDHDGTLEGDEQPLRESIFRAKLGNNFPKKAFEWAHDADPDAKLYICEYDILGNPQENQSKANLMYDLVTQLISQNVPIHGVAEQMHIANEYVQDTSYYSTEMDKYGNLGLEFQITECTVSINEDRTGITDEKLEKQAKLVTDVLLVCLSKPYFTGFSFWGLTDRYTYLGSNEWPVLFDRLYVPKPVYYSIYKLIKEY